jgi:hypothetical protein
MSSTPIPTPTPTPKPKPNNLRTPPPGFALPPQKLRALVALYHQSQSFVTLENLDEAIDRAFADATNVRMFGTKRLDWPTLRLEVKDRERLSKFGLPETIGSEMSMYEPGWEGRERRIEKVFDAMYGTWQTNKPGLELLQDTWEDVEERLKGEREE